MQDWALHSDSTGGYFQCNRFVMTASNNNGGSGSGDGSGTASEGGSISMWSEDRGNAHAETVRMRQRNKRMARFIHHFTRLVS